MIDTVCLLIPKSKITMMDATKYDLPAWNLHSKTDAYDKFVKNPSKKNLKTGMYFPRLTGYKRKDFTQDSNIRIEFSVPKLIFQNNLDELEEKDFPIVIETLHAQLMRMGLLVHKSTLEMASVSSVHFSKNILLKNGFTSSHLISEMNKVNLRKTFDFARARFINDGQSLYIHTKAHQFVIYDKIADLNKGKHRAIDKEPTLYQQSLFPEIKRASEMIEVIRFEIRLNHKQKMNNVLCKLGYKKNPVFKEVFNAEMSQKIVTDYWNAIIKTGNVGLFSISLGIKEILRTIYGADSQIKPKQAIYLGGLLMLAKDGTGIRELRSIITKTSHDRTWYRVMKDMQLASEMVCKGRLRDWVEQIDNCLSNYKPYKYKKMSTD